MKDFSNFQKVILIFISSKLNDNEILNIAECFLHMEKD